MAAQMPCIGLNEHPAFQLIPHLLGRSWIHFELTPLPYKEGIHSITDPALILHAESCSVSESSLHEHLQE